MDIKRKISPTLGDDIVIRIFFGEVLSGSLGVSESGGLLTQGGEVEMKSSERVMGARYKEIPRAEEGVLLRDAAVLEL
jgi:hypothetical protein